MIAACLSVFAIAVYCGARAILRIVRTIGDIPDRDIIVLSTSVGVALTAWSGALVTYFSVAP